VRLQWRRCRLDEELPGHAEVGEQRVVTRRRSIQGQPQVLPASARGRHGTAAQTVGEVGGTREVPTYRARGQYLTGGDATPHDVRLQAAPDDLDLGQLGHASRRRAR
jgi:hypothetical protein